MTEPLLLVFGAGYCGTAIAAASLSARLVSRAPGPGMADFAAPPIAAATHVLITAPPGPTADPVLETHAAAIAAAPDLRWIGYLSTTGVYGDHGGGWVDEDTAPNPTNPRSVRRRAAEIAWAGFAPRIAVDIFRLAGIYGPGRSPFESLANGTARRLDRPGHCFGRIHRDDITGAVLAAIAQAPPAGLRVFNLADDEPAEPQAVITWAAHLAGLPCPPLTDFADATLSPMAHSFWAENRRVRSESTQQRLDYRWRYPTYRSGLAAILAEQRRHGAAEQP